MDDVALRNSAPAAQPAPDTSRPSAGGSCASMLAEACDTETSLLDRWHVLRTRSRQEKALGSTLTSAGFEVFLPLVSQVRIYGHRKRKTDSPLFPGYVFLWGPLEAAYFAMESGRIAQIIRVADQQRLDHELKQIRLALAGDAQLDPYPYLRVGHRVRVTQGPFRGIEGIVDERRSPDRLILVIDALGRATCMEIDASILAPID